jgi:predicted nucleic acid-binding protein
VTLVIDAAPIVALADAGEPLRDDILAELEAEPGELIIPAPVTAEVHYLLGQRFGTVARRAFLRDLAAARFMVVALERDDYTAILDLESRYADLDLGLADCSVAILAGRYRTTRVLSFDQRHFRAITPPQGGAFTILPADGDRSAPDRR